MKLSMRYLPAAVALTALVALPISVQAQEATGVQSVSDDGTASANGEAGSSAKAASKPQTESVMYPVVISFGNGGSMTIDHNGIGTGTGITTANAK